MDKPDHLVDQYLKQNKILKEELLGTEAQRKCSLLTKSEENSVCFPDAVPQRNSVKKSLEASRSKPVLPGNTSPFVNKFPQPQTPPAYGVFNK